jgi:hypothetical protein
MPTLKCFAVLCYENEAVSKATATGVLIKGVVSHILMKFMDTQKLVHFLLLLFKKINE